MTPSVCVSLCDCVCLCLCKYAAPHVHGPLCPTPKQSMKSLFLKGVLWQMENRNDSIVFMEGNSHFADKKHELEKDSFYLGDGKPHLVIFRALCSVITPASFRDQSGTGYMQSSILTPVQSLQSQGRRFLNEIIQ